jgi:hypothetical protein
MGNATGAAGLNIVDDRVADIELTAQAPTIASTCPAAGGFSMDLERVWQIREEEIYPTLFGPVSRGIFPLSQQLFAERFRQSDVDPRWLFCGVFEFAPTADRQSWLYVTSGYSNPWDEESVDFDPNGESYPSGGGRLGGRVKARS